MSTHRFITIGIDETSEFDHAQAAQLIHRAVPGSHMIVSRTLPDSVASDFEWDLEDGFSLPMDATTARQLANDDGHVRVIVTVDQEAYLAAYSDGLRCHENDHYDLVHDLGFSFGIPYDSSVEILAANKGDFIVAYTTDVLEAIENQDF